MNAKIRLLSAADAAEYYALKLQGFATEGGIFATSPEDWQKKTVSQIAETLEADNTAFVFGSFCEGELVGIVEFHRNAGQYREHLGLISGMYVLPQDREVGRGRKLLAEAIARARTIDGVEGLWMVVAAQAEPALNLYKSVGFVEFGREDKSLKIGDDYIVGVYLNLLF